MKLYSFYTPSHKFLKDVFTGSIQDDYEMKIILLDDFKRASSAGGGMTT